MDNRIFYTAIKNTIDYYREKEKNGNGFDIIKTEFKDFEEKDFEEYHEDFDYRIIFLRSYYRRYLDTSPSLDYEGKEIHWEERLVAEIMFNNLKKQFRDRPDEMMSLSKYSQSSDISDKEYQELLEKHDLLYHTYG